MYEPREETARVEEQRDSVLVETVDLVKVYEDKDAVPVRALDGIFFLLREGEFTAIAGPSGSGKTTLLNIIGGIDKPTSGKVAVAGNDLSTMSRSALATFRLANIGFGRPYWRGV